uniref:Plastidal glycolate/glycerate translocator 1, chloroplastic n=1 Tax=Ananas comosus var. bracteatus TaxID=296719 RepID=A0A6V7QXR2_ANACO
MAAASTIRIRPPVSALPLTTSTLRKPTSIPTTRCPSPSLPRPIVSSRFNPSSSPPPRSLGPRFGFRHTDNGDDDVRHRNLLVPARSAGTEAGQAAFGFPTIVKFLHLAVSLGIILAADKLLRKAFLAASIKFPSALFGMFCVFSVLMILDSTAPSAATGFMNFFEPATLFIQRWLPLFYVPSLVVLPLAVRDVPAASGLKIFLILVGGWLASLMVAGYTAITVRRIVQTEMIPAEPMTKPSPFTAVELWAWAAIFVLSFALALVYPTALSTSAGTCLPFLLAATVLGYMIGSGLPSNVKQVFHPIICCAASADLAALAYGYLSRSGMDAVLGNYLTKVSSNPGAGDILMGFSWLCYHIICFLNVQTEKGRLVGLEPILTVSILPRCITVALALSIVSFFEGANASLTAAAVVLTGLVGANFVQAVMDKLRLNDPIARGIATASSAHGLGTAALSAKEPEALPFCAIAYALTGIFGSLICSVPAVRQSLVLIAG